MESEKEKKIIEECKRGKEENEIFEIKADIIDKLKTNPAPCIDYFSKKYPDWSIYFVKIKNDNQLSELLSALHNNIIIFEAKINHQFELHVQDVFKDNLFTVCYGYKGKIIPLDNKDTIKSMEAKIKGKENQNKKYQQQINNILKEISQENVKLILEISDLKYNMSEDKLVIIPDQEFVNKNLDYYNPKATNKKFYNKYVADFWIHYFLFQIKDYESMKKIRQNFNQPEKAEDVYSVVQKIVQNSDNCSNKILPIIKSVLLTLSPNSQLIEDMLKFNCEESSLSISNDAKSLFLNKSNNTDSDENPKSIQEVVKLSISPDSKLELKLDENIIQKLKENPNFLGLDLNYSLTNIEEYLKKIIVFKNHISGLTKNNIQIKDYESITNQNLKNSMPQKMFNVFVLVIHLFENCLQLNKQSQEESLIFNEKEEDFTIIIPSFNLKTRDIIILYLLFFITFKLLLQIKIYINQMTLYRCEIDLLNVINEVKIYLETIKSIYSSINRKPKAENMQNSDENHEEIIIPKIIYRNLKTFNNELLLLNKDKMPSNDGNNLKNILKEEKEEEEEEKKNEVMSEKFSNEIEEEKKNANKNEILSDSRGSIESMANFFNVPGLKNPKKNNLAQNNAENQNLEILQKKDVDLQKLITENKQYKEENEKLKKFQKDVDDFKNKFALNLKEFRLKIAIKEEQKENNPDLNQLLNNSIGIQEKILLEDKQNKEKIENLNKEIDNLKKEFTLKERNLLNEININIKKNNDLKENLINNSQSISIQVVNCAIYQKENTELKDNLKELQEENEKNRINHSHQITIKETEKKNLLIQLDNSSEEKKKLIMDTQKLKEDNENLNKLITNLNNTLSTNKSAHEAELNEKQLTIQLKEQELNFQKSRYDTDISNLKQKLESEKKKSETELKNTNKALTDYINDHPPYSNTLQNESTNSQKIRCNKEGKFLDYGCQIGEKDIKKESIVQVSEIITKKEEEKKFSDLNSNNKEQLALNFSNFTFTKTDVPVNNNNNNYYEEEKKKRI